MVGSTPPPPTPTEAATATTRDQLVASARSVPDLIAKAQAIDPALAAQLTAKPLIASKTPVGVLVGMVIGWGLAKYGLACAAGSIATNCWTSDDINLAAGVATMAGGVIASYVMRYITSSPIAGIFSKGATP